MPEVPDKWQHGLGLCAVTLTIDGSGRPTDVKAVAASTPELAKSALVAIKNWRFAPAKVDGKSVSVPFRVPIVFPPRSSSER